MKKKLFPLLRGCVLAFIFLCLIATGISAWINRGLPTQSKVTDRLSELEKARLAEAVHLRQALGDQVWLGWGQADIPQVVYNEAYAFIVGYPDPPSGWTMMPRHESRGGAWQIVPAEAVEGQPYYRQALSSPDLTPENFTVMVGQKWAASMQTDEYSEIAFYAGFREQLPSFVRPVFPYRLAWNLIAGKTDTTIQGLAHEAFHAYQGTLVPSRLAEAENINRLESQYPWDDAGLTSAWKSEMELLVQAVRAPTDTEARDLASRFLQARDQRRLSLKAELADYEQQREWLEGLAKYTELELGRLAAVTPDYAPLPAILADPNFNSYQDRARFMSEQLGEAQVTQGRNGETRLYYSGLAQAMLLDRLLPGWKEKAFEPDVTIETLLRQTLIAP